MVFYRPGGILQTGLWIISISLYCDKCNCQLYKLRFLFSSTPVNNISDNYYLWFMQKHVFDQNHSKLIKNVKIILKNNTIFTKFEDEDNFKLRIQPLYRNSRLTFNSSFTETWNSTWIKQLVSPFWQVYFWPWSRDEVSIPGWECGWLPGTVTRLCQGNISSNHLKLNIVSLENDYSKDN